MRQEFADSVRSEAALHRLAERTGGWIGPEISAKLLEASDPDLALSNLDRWVSALTSPVEGAFLLGTSEVTCRLFMKVLGASSQLADVLVQNPELAALILDPTEVTRPVTQELVEDQGRRLLDSAWSYSHTLDRLRFLKQWATLRIAAADLGRLWPEEEVWRSLSETADACLHLVREVAWKDFAESRNISEACPLNIVGMGKLGGCELNYSSDIDLIFLLPDDLDDELEQLASRFAEKLVRAIADRMGRGFLYRVDMRLRPFGSAGPMVCKMKAAETYFHQYAEPWEHMALIRARPICMSHELSQRWLSLRTSCAFDRPRSDLALESILQMKGRMEERTGPDDLKRMPGGIRDIEFPIQILQLIHGRRWPDVRVAGTIPAITALGGNDLIPAEACEQLQEAYTFLRQSEHQCQIVSELQTHQLPAGDAAREFLARRMGFSNAPAFLAQLELHMARVRHWRPTLLPGLHKLLGSARGQVLELVASEAPIVSAWFDRLPESEEFYASLVENKDSLNRVRRVAQYGPALLSALQSSVAATEQIMSGEVLEATLHARFDAKSDQDLARNLRRSWLLAAVKHCLDPKSDFSQAWARHISDFISYSAAHIAPNLTVISLGSLADQQMSLHSDVDLMLLGETESEESAEKFASFLQGLRPLGSPIKVDFRLRPEGGRGPLVVTKGALAKYFSGRAEIWERMAWVRARILTGNPLRHQEFLSIVKAGGLSTKDAEDLNRMRQRIRIERIAPGLQKRHIKLGNGGLLDLHWMVSRAALEYPDLEILGMSLNESLSRLRSLGLTSEGADLDLALRGMTRLRVQLSLLGQEDDICPDSMMAEYQEWRAAVEQESEALTRSMEAKL